MLYLTPPNTGLVGAAITAGDLGAFIAPASGNVLQDGWRWAMDNGCFTGWDEPTFLAALRARRRWRASCLFVAVPDVVGDWPATLDRWAEWRHRPELAGWRRAVVVQDGARVGEVPWAEADALFVGGSTDWKLSEAAAGLVGEARRRGLWAHMGRVNSRKRLGAAISMGCDSVDGTRVVFAPDENLRQLLGWVAAEEAAPRMVFDA